MCEGQGMSKSLLIEASGSWREGKTGIVSAWAVFCSALAELQDGAEGGNVDPGVCSGHFWWWMGAEPSQSCGRGCKWPTGSWTRVFYSLCEEPSQLLWDGEWGRLTNGLLCSWRAQIPGIVQAESWIFTQDGLGEAMWILRELPAPLVVFCYFSGCRNASAKGILLLRWPVQNVLKLFSFLFFFPHLTPEGSLSRYECTAD